MLIILIISIINALCYFGVWWVWRKDCKEIGAGNLAVPLSERFITLFGMLTLPSILVIIYLETKVS